MLSKIPPAFIFPDLVIWKTLNGLQSIYIYSEGMENSTIVVTTRNPILIEYLQAQIL